MRDKSGKEKEEEEEEKEAARRVTSAIRGKRSSRHMLSRSFSETSSSSYESALMGEAHGIVTDMLVDSSLPPHIISGLEALSNLLRPPEVRRPLFRTRMSRMVSLLESSFGSDNEESPFIGERPCDLAEKLHHGLHPCIRRRVTSGTWTTTTSATGMPTLEPGPCSRRTCSPRQSQEDQTPNPSPSPSPSYISSPSPFFSSSPIPKSLSFSVWSVSSLSCGRGFFWKNVEEEEGEEERESGGVTAACSNGTALSQGASQPAPAGSSQKAAKDTTTSQSNDRTTDEQQQQQTDRGMVNTGKEAQDQSLVPTQSQQQQLGSVEAKDTDEARSKPWFTVEDVEKSPFLETSQLNEWGFPIFDYVLQEKTFALSKMAYRLFTIVNLMDTFRIPELEFINYFHSLELGYRDNPYHNRMHATDVLHGVYYLTTRPIPGFTTTMATEAGDRTLNRNPGYQADDTYGFIGENLTALELLALYTAAAMHDYDHPGRTNAFLVATHAPQAILYNDRAVLENHHVASAWSLLLYNPQHNFLTGLQPAEFKRFRFLVIEIVLATDLKRHFEILAEFNAKVNDEEGSGLDWSVETDRLLALQAVVKLADISGPLKPLALHLQWTVSIAEEFYQQGDEEAALGLPVSPYMDRRHPQLAKLQETFINHLVAPLCNAIADGGLLPAAWVNNMEDIEEEEEEQLAKKEGRQQKSWRVHCPLTENLRDNLDYWIRILKEELSTPTATAAAVQSGNIVRVEDGFSASNPRTRSPVLSKSSQSTEETTNVDSLQEESAESR